MALAPSLGWLFVRRLISGITSASFSTAGAYIADVTAEGRKPKTWPCRRGWSVSRAMSVRWLLCVLVLGSLSACLQLGQGLDSDAGTASPGSAGTGTGGDASAPATGTNCGVDPSSGVSLCLGISSCPGVTVDPDQYPGCGYRISGTTIDLECLCDDSLCPMGSAASCLDAKALLTDQSALGVCAGIADGLCETVKQTRSSNLSSACDKQCRSECGGDPNCITLCGC